ncbi:uncharacterized protein LOC122278602 [Carya illinoinensis]|uniref:uncharacterized protein LOC122278602 n=1 Tax=Carya illinoinensis TaxID=32201 RepID=UPI001C7182C2|nr:uncharacterized protein LOC122278602 [Carya illinoinensis]
MGDKVIWGLSEKGKFSVKSAYYADLETKNQKTGETSNGDQNERLWRKVWRLTNSGKVKQFLWEALNGILPTRSILFKRRIIDNSTCPVCNREEETDIHVLWDCPASVDVCGEDCSPVRKWGRNYADFTTLWSNLQSKLEEGKLHIVAEVLYDLWKRRNDMVFEGKFKGPCVLIQQAVQEVETVNVDASMDSKRGKVGIGVVVRDFRGEVHVVVAAPIQVIEDIKAVVHAQPGWSVTFKGRDGNRGAHAVAKLALSLSTECVWMEEVPTEVLPAVVSDLPSFVMSV